MKRVVAAVFLLAACGGEAATTTLEASTTSSEPAAQTTKPPTEIVDPDDLGLLLEQAEASMDAGQFEDALATLDEALHVYEVLALGETGSTPDPDLVQALARVLDKKGFVLGELGRVDEALIVYEQVITGFGDSDHPVLVKAVATALLESGYLLFIQERWDEALAFHEQLITRFGDSTDAELVQNLALAMTVKGLELESLGREEEALAAYEQVITRFGDSTDAEIVEAVTAAQGQIDILSRPKVSVLDLAVGDCGDWTYVDRRSVFAASCSDPHGLEVYALAAFSAGSQDEYPGDDAVEEFSGEACFDAFNEQFDAYNEHYVDADYGNPSGDATIPVLTFSPIGPTSQSWLDGDRKIVCVLIGATPFDSCYVEAERCNPKGPNTASSP